MENKNRATAPSVPPKKVWHNAKADERLYRMSIDDDPDEEDEEEEEKGDWGHTDPAEGNNPFPDSNEPSSPGSAV